MKQSGNVRDVPYAPSDRTDVQKSSEDFKVLDGRKPLRAIDLARAVGVGTQTIRRYERWNIIPPAERAPSGYRIFGPTHLQATRTARVLVDGFTRQQAYDIMRFVHQGRMEEAVTIVHRRHADLAQRTNQVLAALEAIRRLARRRTRARADAAVPIKEASMGTGVPGPTLRFWEQSGLIRPARDHRNGYRLFDADQIGRIEAIMLLRRAGSSIAAIRDIIVPLDAGAVDEAMRRARLEHAQVSAEGWRCVAATAALWGYLQSRRVEDAADVPGWSTIGDQPDSHYECSQRLLSRAAAT